MHGNAAEWCIDGFGPYVASEKPVHAAADWVRTDQPDPRVVRGGTWEFSAAKCRSSAGLGRMIWNGRLTIPTARAARGGSRTDPARGVGFRLLRALKPLPREQIEEFWKIDSEDIEFDVDDRIRGGRGVFGLVDKDLPQANSGPAEIKGRRCSAAAGSTNYHSRQGMKMAWEGPPGPT